MTWLFAVLLHLRLDKPTDLRPVEPTTQASVTSACVLPTALIFVTSPTTNNPLKTKHALSSALSDEC
ncbi:MAG: hypothetical protein WCH60_18580 [Burkholderiales bacterium]